MSDPTNNVRTLLELFTTATEGLPFIRIATSLPSTTFSSSQLKFLLAHARLTRWAYFVRLHDDVSFAVPEPLKSRLRTLLRLLDQLIATSREISLLDTPEAAQYFEPEDLQNLPRLVYDRLSLATNTRLGTSSAERIVTHRKWAVRSKPELDELHRKIALLSSRLEETIPLAPMHMGDYEEDDEGRGKRAERARGELQAMANRDVKGVLAAPESVEDPRARAEQLNVARLVRDDAQEVDPYVYQIACNMVQTLRAN